MENKQGLNRYIDAETRRQVRQNSRFSCVVCRAPFCTYEHFDPPFADAREHNADGICLLCWTCQGDSLGGRLSKDVIRRLYEKRRRSDQVSSCRGNFLFFTHWPIVEIGDSTIRYADAVICTDREDCLSFHRDDSTGMFFLNMQVFDPDGNKVFEIIDNTWTSDYRPWDFEFNGGWLTFRSGPGQILFRANLDPQRNRIEVTHLDMGLQHARVRIENGRLVITRWSFDRTRYMTMATRFLIVSAKAAIFVDNRDDVPRAITKIPIFHSPFAGVTIGRLGNGSLREISIWLNGIQAQPGYKGKKEVPDHREAFIAGKLDVIDVAFPFWTEHEYFLNGIQVSQRPYSVDDGDDEAYGQGNELYHVGADDADLFSAENGLVAFTEHELPRPPKRPHRFL